MTGTLFSKMILGGCYFLIPAWVHARDIKDSTQTKIQLVDRRQRIVTVTPALGELVSDFLKGQLQRLVGVSEYTNYPVSLQKITSIGPYHQFNLEKVTALRPDLVFASTDGNSKDQIH